MALADTGKAIGAVSRTLHDQLVTRLGAAVLSVSVGKPEPASSTATGSRLNLFLYEVQFDRHLRNVPLDTGQPPPLWLVLKYLLTAFDQDGESDSDKAHDLLGQGVRALQELAFLPPGSGAATLDPLIDNPEPLKLTFDPTSSELLSRLMQGTDEKYRCSISFEVRPVMIATGEPSSYSLLVGIDYTKTPPEVKGEERIRLDVIPSLGPRLTSIVPAQFAPGDTLTLRGSDLHLSNLEVSLGPATLEIVSRNSREIQCTVDGKVSEGKVISAGSHPISVSLELGSGRRRRSNLLVGGLLPVLDTADPKDLVHQVPADHNSPVSGNIDLTGTLLGTDQDDVFVALFRDGRTVRLFDSFSVPDPAPTDPQTGLRIVIPVENRIPAGKYQVILRANGQQARNSPTVDLAT